MFRRFLFPIALILLMQSAAWATLTVIPADSARQDSLTKVYRLAMLRSQVQWTERGEVDPALAVPFGEVPLLWAASGDPGSFLLGDTLPLTYSSLRNSSAGGFSSATYPRAYSLSRPGGMTIAVFDAITPDPLGQSLTWGWAGVTQILVNNLGLTEGSSYRTLSEATMDSLLLGPSLLIIPPMALYDDAGSALDSMLAHYPAMDSILTLFLERGGTIYTEGNGALLLEKAGLLPAGSVTLARPIEGPALAGLLATVTRVAMDLPTGFPIANGKLYTTMGPHFTDFGTVVARFATAANPLDIGSPAVIHLEPARPSGWGRIICNAGLPITGNTVYPASVQWQWTANGILSAYAHRIEVVRSINTHATYGGDSVQTMALPLEDSVTFDVSVHVRNLWDTPVSGITLNEYFRDIFSYVGTTAGPAPTVAGVHLTFGLGGLAANGGTLVNYQLTTRPGDSTAVTWLRNHVDYRQMVSVSSDYASYTDPRFGTNRGFSRWTLYCLWMFEAQLVADTDLNWKNILGDYYQPFKIFTMLENKGLTKAADMVYTQYIPLDVPIYTVGPRSIPIIRTPGDKFVDLLRGSDDINRNGVLDPGELTSDMDGDGNPDAWLDFRSIYPPIDLSTVTLEQIYWLNPWTHQYEDIDRDGDITVDADSDGVFEHEDPGDKIRAYKITYDFSTLGMTSLAAYGFKDPLCYWELWIDPPNLVDMAKGAPDTLGYDGPEDGFHYDGWLNWMFRDSITGTPVFRRLVYQHIDSYEGFAFVDSFYRLRPDDVDYGWVPYPNREYIAVLNLGGDEPTMDSPFAPSSLYGNVDYNTIWGRHRKVPIRTTYTYYAPLPNPMQFEYVQQSYQILDPADRHPLPYLPAYGSAIVQFDVTASTEYSLYWIRMVGTDTSDVPDGVGDGVFGYMIADIPKGMGGYTLNLPRRGDGSFDTRAIVPDYVPLIPPSGTVRDTIEVWQTPTLWRIYIPQVLIPPALDDDNGDGVDDWLDDRGDRFHSPTGWLHDAFPSQTGEEVVAAGLDTSGWYEGPDHARGDDLVEALGTVHFTINAIYTGSGREGNLQITRGIYLVNEEIFGGSPWVQWSHALAGYAEGTKFEITGKCDPTSVSLHPDSTLIKYRVRDLTEPHAYDDLCNPWVQSRSNAGANFSLSLGGNDPCWLISPDVNFPSRVQPASEARTLTLLPNAHLGDSATPGYPRATYGVFVLARLEVNNSTDEHWYGTTVRPLLGPEWGASTVEMSYSVYPRPLVPAQVDPVTGEVIREGDDIGAFHAGWRFNPSPHEVLCRLGNPDGSAMIPEILSSRRAYFVFLIRIDPTLAAGTYALNFDLTGGHKSYRDSVMTPLAGYTLPQGLLAIGYPAFTMGKARLSNLSDSLMDYVFVTDPANDVRWSPTEPAATAFSTLPTLSATTTGRMLEITPPYTDFPPGPEATEFWVACGVHLTAPIADNRLPLDVKMRLPVVDANGQARTDSGGPVNIAARGAKIKMVKALQRVNGVDLAEDDQDYQLNPTNNDIMMRIRGQNSGSGVAQSPTLTCKIGPYMTFDPADPGDVFPATYDQSQRTITWTLPDMVPGMKRDLLVKLRAPQVNVDTTLIIATLAKVRYDIFEDSAPETLAYYVDLAAANLVCTPPNPKVGDVVTLSARVRNLGTRRVANPITRFFAGDPNNPTSRIGSDQVVPFLSRADTNLTLSVPWTVTSPPGGAHTLELFARVDPDNTVGESSKGNNTSTLTLILGDAPPIADVINYPNPFKDYTEFTYILTRSTEDVTITLYTPRGRKIKTLTGCSHEVGYNAQPWDTRDADGDFISNGTYVYQITAKGSGWKESVRERAVKMKE